MINFVFFFLLLQLFILSGHFFIFLTIVKFFKVEKRSKKITIGIILLILSSVFTVSIISSNIWTNTFLSIFYFLSAHYLGFSYFFSISAILSFLIFYSVVFLKYLLQRFSLLDLEKYDGVKRVFNFLASSSFIATFFIVCGLGFSILGLYNSYSVKVKEINVSVSNQENSRTNLKGKRFVFLSDIHLGNVYGEKRALYLRDKIIDVNPDIVFLGGDIFDGPHSSESDFSSVFSKDKFPYETIYIQGNHEEIKFEPNRYKEMSEKMGIVFLNNESYVSKKIKNLMIIGTGFALVSDKPSFEFFLKNMAEEFFASDVNGKTNNDEYFKLLLKHSPENNDIAEKFGIDLVISGHTHGGQVWPGNVLTSLSYEKLNYGLVKIGQMYSYTSSGAGTWGMPFRLGTRSEIVVINFI